MEIVWFSVYRNIVNFAHCTGLIQEFKVSQSPNDQHAVSVPRLVFLVLG